MSAVPEIPPILHQILAGRYVLKREIGRGGAATVYLAHDVRHERLVAIKVLHPELSHALGAQRFLREIRLTASLQHPHILPIHDSGQADAQLYYVMPFVEGESLRQRLGANNRLAVEEAVRIGREVSGALAYAHERGVVHRDIKPENILFSGGHAVLADFGIARAINRASEKITQQGTITGTPAYMSPEQARDRAFDGRSDVYSLSCVLYEAIAGVPPYMGDTPQELLTQRIHRAPPLLREYRHDVPPPIEAVIARALSISPDDRFDDARAFSAALSAAIGNSGETGIPVSRRRRIAHSPWLWAAGVALAVTGLAGTSPQGRDQFEIITHRIDAAQYAVLPFQYTGAPAPSVDVEPAASGTYDAMRRWEGLPIASEMSVADALQREGAPPQTLADAARIARSVHAGRVVWGRVRVGPDSVVVRAGIYDAITERTLREATRILRGRGTGDMRSLDFAALVTELLRDPHATAMSTTADRGTTSIAAWRAFERGARAFGQWNVSATTAALQQAVAADPTYANANLWLAQLRVLQDAEPGEWATAVTAAQRGRAALDERERGIADALSEISIGHFPAACRIYGRLAAADSLDALAWLGLGFCQVRDQAIVASPRTATGFAFRSRPEGAWRAFARALDLAPEAIALVPYDKLRRYFPVEHNIIRFGTMGTVTYTAWPYLDGDSVAFAPSISATFANVPVPPGYDGALRQNRDRLFALMERLTRRMPENALAFEGLTEVLEVRDEITGTPNGRYSALTALERARALSTTPDQRLRLAVADLRLHLKLGDFARSAATADSILAVQPPAPTPAQALLLRGVAAYAGHADLAARLERLSPSRDLNGPAVPVPATDEPLARLLMRVALGICGDSVTALVRDVDQALASYVDPAHHAVVRDQLLERAAVLAAPCDTARLAAQLHAPVAMVARAEQRLALGDRDGTRRILTAMNARRRVMRPGGVSLEHVVIEAWLRDATGDPSSASARLDLALAALPTLSPVVVTEPVMAASVGRAMAYRAELAERLGDPSTAALWASRVLTIWAHADRDLDPTITRMHALTARRVAQAGTP